MLRIESTDHDRCCGCTACVSVCGTHALQMEPDAYGFSYPRIDNDLCVGCGRCTRVCPTMAADAQRDLKLRQCMRSVVALASDPTELVTSTSGGMASVLARTFIRQLRGVVYGASAADPYHVRHVRIDCEDQVSQLKGSKYVQSDMEGIIPQIKMDLKDCRNVLFVGTPCQCAGVQLCFPNHGGRLWLVDFVCHGVPSQQMLNDAYKELGVDVGSVAFRRKDAGGNRSMAFSSATRRAACATRACMATTATSPLSSRASTTAKAATTAVSPITGVRATLHWATIGTPTASTPIFLAADSVCRRCMPTANTEKHSSI